MVLKKKGIKTIVLFLILAVAVTTVLVKANYYTSDLYFVVPYNVYTTGEQIELKGYLYEANYSDNGTLATSSSLKGGYTVNITINNKSDGVVMSNYTLTTDSSGIYYSNSTYYGNYTRITAPTIEGEYIIKAQYIDANSTVKYSTVEISVVNESVDTIKISTDKLSYDPSETIIITAVASAKLKDRTKYLSGVSINGSIRNASKDLTSSSLAFNCTTDTSGKCVVTKTAPTTHGTYVLEANNFKSYSSLTVIPFVTSAYMKDELGKSYKNTFSLGEQASIEVSVVDNTTTSSYNFSGYVADSSGNVVQLINSTNLNSNNSYNNKFIFSVNSLSGFSYGTYYTTITIRKSSGANQTQKASFEVKDWKIVMNKRSSESGFEYEYSAFPNKTLTIELYPRYRTNASLIPGINSTSFSVNLTDELNNNILSANVSYNTTCGTEGCYQFSFKSPLTLGSYKLKVKLSNGGDTQTASKEIKIIDRVMQAQSTDSEGNIKELFGTSEAAYISVNSYSNTTPQINLSEIEVFSVTYMNGTTLNYTNVTSFSSVNTSNSVYEWAVNLTTQRIKMDVPKYGGSYEIYVFGENRTVAGFSKIIANPYDVCTIAKSTSGQVSSSNGDYYVSQFKTTSTIYFELKIVQANNPLGRATISNFTAGSSSNSSGGNAASSSGCTVNTQTQQAVSNATISVISVKNTNNGATYAINSSSSVCTTSDSSGGYTCTVQPAVKWDGGTYSALMRITGPDGQTQDDVYGFFEARAFYIHGWSQNWQVQPTSNITLTAQMYEAGRNWWSSYGSGGLSGTISVERVEYQGRQGEWVWPPVSYNYNTSAINSTTFTAGQGTINLPVQYAPGGVWKTGYYRAILKGTDSSGNVDYGYAWFNVKRWEVFGTPIECTSSNCNYKSYFNSKENVTMYVQIYNAGSYSYSYNGGESIGGNVSISVKKIEDCRTWPCKELNSSVYTSNTIVVNGSNKGYWNANSSQGTYFLRINRTSGTWGTGYYSVVLDVNGTETGSGWFNTIAFYTDLRPTNSSGDTTSWHYEIKNNEVKYFNATATSNYKGWGSSYSASDYINVTLTSAKLRLWDETTYQTRELSWPTDFNISPNQINGSTLLNISKTGSWSSGYYWGELLFNNSAGETSTSWASFSVRPFRVSISTNSYQIDTTSCLNTTIMIYEPTWTQNRLLNANYKIQEVSENIWTGSSNSKIVYTNYSNSTFTNQTNLAICPNATTGKWSNGNSGWNGYHSLNILINDTQNNATQSGWVSFQAVPFSTSWSGVIGGNSRLLTQNVNVSVRVRSGTNTSVAVQGNISKIYQWRSTSSGGFSSREEYNFSITANSSSATSACDSWTSGQCTINSSTTIIIYAPNGGWNQGSNYLYAEWNEVADRTSTINDWYGIYFEGRDVYSGTFSNYDRNGVWKYYFPPGENLSIKLQVQDSSYQNINATIQSVEYSTPTSSCWSESCRTYTTASWNITAATNTTMIGGNGSVINIFKTSSSDWSKGEYFIRATITGINGTATIKGGRLMVKDMTAPNVSISSPAINATLNGTTYSLTATTTETANCNINLISYNNYYSWASCASLNSSGSALIDSCNVTKYRFNSTVYYSEYISKDYRSATSGANYNYWYSSGTTGLSTDSTTHTYTINLTNPVNNTRLINQSYGIIMYCYDTDWNNGVGYTAFNINSS